MGGGLQGWWRALHRFKIGQARRVVTLLALVDMMKSHTLISGNYVIYVSLEVLIINQSPKTLLKLLICGSLLLIMPYFSCYLSFSIDILPHIHYGEQSARLNSC